jgi:hypothetical protein
VEPQKNLRDYDTVLNERDREKARERQTNIETQTPMHDNRETEKDKRVP